MLHPEGNSAARQITELLDHTKDMPKHKLITLRDSIEEIVNRAIDEAIDREGAGDTDDLFDNDETEKSE